MFCRKFAQIKKAAVPAERWTPKERSLFWLNHGYLREYDHQDAASPLISPAMIIVFFCHKKYPWFIVFTNHGSIELFFYVSRLSARDPVTLLPAEPAQCLEQMTAPAFLLH